MTLKKQPKGELAVLESLYDLYKSNLDNKSALNQIATIAWEVCFTLKVDNDGPFHSLAELANATIAYGKDQAKGGHYVNDIEEAIYQLKQNPENFYE